METLNFAVEAFSLVVVTTVLVVLLIHPSMREVSRLPGWRLLMVAGVCYALGQFADFTDRFEWMARFVLFGPTPGEVLIEGLVGAVAATVLGAIGLARWLPAVILHEREARAQFRVLSGLLPICASCKRIRAEDGEWEQIEAYIDEHSEARFSHGVCPTCATAHYGELLDEAS